MLVLSSLLACHLGRPPPAGAAWRVIDVHSAAVEPGLDATLEAAVNGALAVRGALGGSSQLRLVVLDASSTVAAADAGGEVQVARLRVRVEVVGVADAALVLQAEEPFGVRAVTEGGASATLAATTSRAAAFESLSAQLASDAADWLLVTGGGGR